MKEMNQFRRLKILQSDLSLGGRLESDHNFNLESELELELLGIKLNSGSQTFPLITLTVLN